MAFDLHPPWWKLELGGVGDMALEPQTPREDAAGGVPQSPLTPREQEVLSLLSLGMSNAAIAATLHIGVSTVKTHLSAIFWKLGVSNRTQAGVAGSQMSLPIVPDSVPLGNSST